MATELRKTGISVVGDLPWGAHFCYFYETKQDLLDILIPYFKTGLENKEFCLWVISNSELLTVDEAKSELRKALPDLDRYLAERSIEVVGHNDWFLTGDTFDPRQVVNRFRKKLDEALARGYAGMRVNGSPAWLHDAGQKELRKFEAELDKLFPSERTIASCTYPLASIGGEEIFDVVRTHQFAIARRQGEWEVVETPELIQAKAEIKRLNDELEQKVIERTDELRVANEELRKEIAERQQAEALLHAKEQEFRAIVENAPDQIIRYDREFRRTYVNPAVAQFYGLPAEALIGKPIGSNIPQAGAEIKEDEVARVRQRIADVFNTGKTYDYELTWTMPTGRTYFAVRLFPELDLDGLVVNVLGISRDITERKQAEDVLRRSEDHLRLIIDTIPMMAWSLRADAVLDFVNQRWLDYTGLSLEEAIADPTRPMHPEDLPSAMAEWGANTAAGEPFENEMRLRRADGQYRWFLIRTDPLRDELGRIVKWYGVSIDIEDRKLAEERLKQSESQLAEAQRLAHVGGWDWDLRSDAVTWSDELYRIVGFQPGGIDVAHEATSPIHPEDRDMVLNTVMSSVKNREPFSFYYRILRPNGDERIVHSSGHIVSDEEGEPIRVFGATQDVTELKLAEEKLKATTEQLRALSARFQSAREEEGMRIAREIHDELGSALTSLKWDLEGMEKMLSDPKSGPELASMKGKAKTMTRLVDGTIDVVRRISAELRPGVLDDLGLVSAIEWQARQFHDRTGITVDCDCSLDVGLSQEQSTTVFRILQEALTNVLRHAQATRVSIRAAEEAGEFVLTISDNGKGISEDETSGLLSLGLLGMRERAILIGGKIDIAGVPGKGTVITLRVPLGRAGRTFGAGK